MFTKFLVSIEGTERTRYVRGSKRPIKLYVTAVNWSQTNGLILSSFSYGKDRNTAAEFAKFTAMKVSEQLNSSRFRVKSTVEANK